MTMNPAIGRATGRYAIYFAPAVGTTLHECGSRWLGRDALRGIPSRRPDHLPIPSERIESLTRSASHYGFHATLKPPFVLHPSTDPDSLRATTARLANAEPPVRLRLKLGWLDGFLALVEATPDPAVSRLAAVTVQRLDRFRAPPRPEELEHRRRAGLDDRQEQLLRRWGYPHVMDRFRFHMTLTSRIAGHADAEPVRLALERQFAAVVERELIIDAVSIFSQGTPASPFNEWVRLPLGGAVNQASSGSGAAAGRSAE